MVLYRCGRLRLVVNAWGVLPWNLFRAANPLQLDVRVTVPLLPTGLQSASPLRRMQGRVLETGGFETLRYTEPELWCGKSQASYGAHAMTPEYLQESLWHEFFADPRQWCDNRRKKTTPGNPDFWHKKSKAHLWLNNQHKPAWVDSQLASWDAGMKTTPESVATSVERKGAFARLGFRDRQLEVGMCRKLCEDGRIADAVNLLSVLVQRGCHVPSDLFYQALKRCIAHKDLVLGRHVHVLTVESGYEGDGFLATHLIVLYASLGRLDEAMGAFTKVSTPSFYNWATIIFAYARHGEAAQAIGLYRQMVESTSFEPTDHIYVAVLKACSTVGDLFAGKQVHADILARPGKANIFVRTCLVSMYAKCRSLEDARGVFDTIRDRNVVTWTAMIAGYAERGMGKEALTLYCSMQQEGITPNSVTYVCLLQACSSEGVGALDQGKQLHAQIKERGLQDHVDVGGSLVNMYAKCGSLEDARRVFDRLPHKNVVTWTAMIAGYDEQGMGQEALGLYSSMQLEGITSPNSVTFVCLLQACAIVGERALHQGRELHGQIEEQGLEGDEVVGGGLVHMYAKCGSLEYARRVFDRLPARTAVTWNAMIAGYAQQDRSQEALSLYRSMQQEGITRPDSVTFACLFQACARAGERALHQGKQFHAHIQEQGLQDDVALGSSVINMYAKCGSMEDARIAFDRLPKKNVVTWTVMIAGYAQQGLGEEALSLYTSLQQQGIIAPDSVMFVCLLQACASVGAGALNQGKQLHAEIAELGLGDDVVVGGSLVNMYAKCSSLEDALRLFDRLPARNVVTWNVIIRGYAEQGMSQEALSLYTRMQQEGITPPDSVTFVCLLQACAVVTALPLGKHLHAQIEERGMQAEPGVQAALVNMYAKCGNMFDSQQVFESLTERNIESWNALIGGYARQGDSEVVFGLVRRMRLEGIQPDGITFLSVLIVCSHVGLVDKGREYFEAMRTDYGISPTVEHYTCRMDLMARAGHLDEALQMACCMPVLPDGAVWLMLLGSCQKWNNVEVGQQAFNYAVSMDGKDATPYVLMYNIYVSAQMWEAAEEMQARRVKSRARKKQGQSWWTDVCGVAHTFVVGDITNLDS